MAAYTAFERIVNYPKIEDEGKDTYLVHLYQFSVGQRVKCIKGHHAGLVEGEVYKVVAVILSGMSASSIERGIMVWNDSRTAPKWPFYIWDVSRFEIVEN